MGTTKGFKSVILVMLLIAIVGVFASVGLASFLDGPVALTYNGTNVTIGGINIAGINHLNASGATDQLEFATNFKINVSGTLNMSVIINHSAPLFNQLISNVSIILSSMDNNTIATNVTVNNVTENQSIFYFIIDTALLTDATYNISVILHNHTLGAGIENTITNFNAGNFTVDNSAPNAVNLTVIQQFGNIHLNTAGNSTNISGNSSGNFATGNISNRNFTHTGNFTLFLNVTHTVDNGTGIQNVTLVFNNGSGTPFNISLRNGTLSPFLNYTLNLSQLAEGWHNITVVVTDLLNNTNGSTYVQFSIDDTAPAVSVTCDTDKKVGEVVSCTCTATDGVSGVKTGPTFAGSGTNSESSTASDTKSVTTSKCSASDHAGNLATATASWSAAVASSGGGGSGGAAGGVSTGSSGGASGGAYSKKVWTSLNAGETATVTPDKANIAVTKVEFTVTDTVYGAWVRVTNVDVNKLPSAATSALTGKVHDYFEITKNANSLKDNVVGSTTIDFKVAKSWLADNGVAESDVVLLRYTDDGWQELSTTKGADDGTSIIYTATTPGFSFFAIAQSGAATGAVVVEAPDAMEDKTGDAMDDGDTMAKDTVTPTADGGSSLIWWVLGIVVLVAVVYFVRKRKR